MQWQSYHGRVYHRVFIGSEFIDWLLCSRFCETRDDALAFGAALFSTQFFKHWCVFTLGRCGLLLSAVSAGTFSRMLGSTIALRLTRCEAVQ